MPRNRDEMVNRSAPGARAGWDEQFRAMAARGDDRLLDDPAPTEWDETEWQWELARSSSAR